MFFLRRALKGKAFTTVGSSLRPKQGLKKKVGMGRQERQRMNAVTALGPLLAHSMRTGTHSSPLSAEHAATVLEGSMSLSVIKSQVYLFLEWKQWLERVLWQWLDCADRGLPLEDSIRYSQTLTNLQNIYSGRYS